MRLSLLSLLLVFLVSASLLPAAGIISVSGSEITIDLGASAGVQEGMTGSVSLETSAGGAMTTVTIATFEVVAVEPVSCRAKLTQVGEGFTVEAGQRVSFDQSLQPPSPTTATIVIRSNVAGDTAFLDGRRLGPTPQTVEVAPGVHTVRVEKDGYEPAEESVTVGAGQQATFRATLTTAPTDPRELDRLATEAFEGGSWQEAIRWYEALLSAVPGEPLASSRLEKARRALQVERRAAEEAAKRSREEATRREEMQRKLANADYLMDKGDAMRAAGEWELAAEYYRKVAEVDPSFSDAGAKLALSELQWALKEDRQADAMLAIAELKDMELSPGLETAFSKLRSSLLKPGGVWIEPTIDMRFRYIPSGSFTMGSPEGEEGRRDDELQHHVVITRGFWMGENEVTQGQWRAVMTTNPSHFSTCGEDCPVENVSWFDALQYANALSGMAGLQECYRFEGNHLEFVGLQCPGYRLPTEAEWEYAARSGSNYLFSGGNQLAMVGWYGKNSQSTTHPVGQKEPNAWGLRDMTGNVWEWVWDRYGEYSAATATDPQGPTSGSTRVFRGGNWFHDPNRCRNASRYRSSPGNYTSFLGFRLVRTAEPGSSPSASAPTEALARVAADPTPEELYRSSYENFLIGDYALATQGFSEYIRRWPDTDLADNAMYWIGECYYLQDSQQALEVFSKVLADYPTSDKAAAAQLKKGLLYLKLGDRAQGVINLQYVIYEYPRTQEADLARQRLQSLGLTIR